MKCNTSMFYYLFIYVVKLKYAIRKEIVETTNAAIAMLLTFSLRVCLLMTNDCPVIVFFKSSILLFGIRFKSMWNNIINRMLVMCHRNHISMNLK